MPKRKKVTQVQVEPAPQTIAGTTINYDQSLASLYSAASCADTSGDTLVRGSRGGSGLTALEGRFKEIECSLQPFANMSGSYIPARQTVELSIKAYWAFGMLRQVVETMCELASSKIYLKGSSKKTKAFIEAWLEKINISIFTQRFFREYYRSGNCFIYEYAATIKPENIQELESLYSGMGDNIPLKYTILNPIGLSARAALLYDNPEYVLVLDKLQAAALKNAPVSGSPEDKAIYESLDDKTKKDLKQGSIIKLDRSKLTTILYKAQNYEIYGVPLAFPVLQNINAHLELQAIDMAVARTTDRLLLLITMGKAATAEDKTTLNPAAMAALQQMFATNSITRTLVSDFTTNAEWLIPDINKVLGSEKYEIIEKQIAVGLNAIFFNSENEKFASTSIKVQVFVEKLKEAREVFIKDFLQPQVNKICKIINSKSAPEVHFEDISLKDELQWAKLTAQLYGLGLLTAEESLENIQSGKLPTPDESLESQKEFKDLKDNGLYQPTIGNSVALQEQMADQSFELDQKAAQQKAATGAPGRPSGTKSPQSTKKVTPIGASETYSFADLKEVSWAVSDIQTQIEKSLKKQHKLKSLNNTQLSISRDITAAIISNEPKENWTKAVKEYIKEPKDINPESAAVIADLCGRHSIEKYAATILSLAAIKP